MDLHTLKTIFYTLTAVAITEAAFNAWRYFSTRRLWGHKFSTNNRGERNEK